MLLQKINKVGFENWKEKHGGTTIMNIAILWVVFVCRLSIPAFHVVDVRWVREQVDIVDSPPTRVCVWCYFQSNCACISRMFTNRGRGCCGHCTSASWCWSSGTGSRIYNLKTWNDSSSMSIVSWTTSLCGTATVLICGRWHKCLASWRQWQPIPHAVCTTVLGSTLPLMDTGRLTKNDEA